MPNAGEQGDDDRYVVLTGGEPMLQVDAALIDALHEQGFTIAIETNGTLAVPRSIDWICVSPKAGSELVQVSGDELKLVWPQPGSDVERLAALEFTHRLIQPLDDPNAADECAALHRSGDGRPALAAVAPDAQKPGAALGVSRPSSPRCRW